MKTIDEYIKILNDNLDTKDKISGEIIHNTELMLELYSKVLKRVSKKLYCIDEDCYERDNMHLYEFITNLLDIDVQLKKEKYENRLVSLEESTGILNIMDRTLVLLKEDENEMYYQILFHRYFQKNKSTNQDIMDMLDIPNTSFYRYKKEAIKSFAVNLWGFVIPELKIIVDEIKIGSKLVVNW